MNRDELDRRLHHALDARRDPLDDPEFAAALRDHEDLARVVSLRAALAELPSALAPSRRILRRVTAMLAAAALIVTAVCFHQRVEDRADDVALARRYSIAPTILEYRVSKSLRSTDRSESFVFDSTGNVARTQRTDGTLTASSIRVHSGSAR